MALSTIELVIKAVDAWLREYAGSGYSRGKPLTAKPPKGYGFKWQGYLKFCDDLERTLSVATNKNVVLSPAWRKKHFAGTIDEFVAALAQVVDRAKPTKLSHRLVAAAATIKLS